MVTTRKPRKQATRASLNAARVEAFVGADPVAPSAERGIAIVQIDPALIAMIREQRETIERLFGSVDDIPTWDRPWDASWYPDWTDSEEPQFLRESYARVGMEFCYAVAFIAGCAATLDVTPLELLWTIGKGAGS